MTQDSKKAKAYEFDDIATNIFAPLYPAVAGQILAATGVREGVCMDIGSGGGMLGYALLGITDLDMIFADHDADAISIALDRAEEKNVLPRVKGIVCSAHDIPLDDASVDIIISRGSVWFWEDHTAAFKELLRVLKSGGYIYIGGGFGSKEIFKGIKVKMNEKVPDWPESVQKKYAGDYTADSMTETFKSIGGCSPMPIDDESGRWVFCKKD